MVYIYIYYLIIFTYIYIYPITMIYFFNDRIINLGFPMTLAYFHGPPFSRRDFLTAPSSPSGGIDGLAHGLKDPKR